MIRKIVRAFSSIQSIRNQLLLLADYLSLIWWDWGGLRRIATRAGARPVYIASLSGVLYSVKLEAMLAKALQIGGFTPVVVTLRDAWWSIIFFRAFGIDQFVYLDDVGVTDEDGPEAKAFADSLFSGKVDFPNVKSWVVEGAPVGQYALSTLARTLHRGMPDLCERQIREALKALIVKAIVNVRRARRLIAGLEPGGCWLFNEVNYNDYGPLFFASFERENNVIQFGHALRDRALIFKRLTRETYRVHPNSVSPSTFGRLIDQPWTSTHELLLEADFSDRYEGRSWMYRRDQEGTRIKAADDVRAQLKLDPAKKTVVVYSHILWDANLFYGSDLFDDNEHWFVETLKAACRNEKFNWIVKLHPAIKWKMAWDGSAEELSEEAVIREKVGPLPPHVRLVYPNTDINTLALLRMTDIGVTIRGTVGIELAARGIPVITAGTGRYSGFGFTIDSASKSAYLDCLARLEDVEPLTARQLDLAKRYAFALFCLRPWTMSTFENLHDLSVKGFSQFNPRLELRAKRFGELETAPDLRKFSAWAMDRKSVDYMEQWPA